MAPPGLIVAAPASGHGKTVITLGLLRCLRERGTRVGTAKVGPDYIDPAFLSAACGQPCVTLDGWAMRPALVDALAAGIDADLVVAEGVMGLFDGAVGGGGATADIAARLGWPVVLVVDVAGQAASAAALVHGFASFRGDVSVAGVIFNRVGGANHERSIQSACAGLDIAMLGFIPREPRLALPSRHLGLVQARERDDLDTVIADAAGLVAERIDIDALVALAQPTRAARDAPPALPPLSARVAVARDDAFAFAYPHMLDGWRAAGAEIDLFSPLADEPVPAQATSVFLPGGYPELHAARIAGADRFLDSLRRAARDGLPIHGECGGYMVLGESLVDADGETYAMAGLLPLRTSFESPRLHLGYRQATLLEDGPLGAAGAGFRGHEFHYCRTESEDGEPLFAIEDSTGAARGDVGLRKGSVCGSFIHLVDRV